MQKPLLEVRDLSLDFRVFKGTLKVLDGINFTVWPNETVGIIGESGGGKTTMVKAIMRILGTTSARISRGEILFKGKDILKMNQAQVQKLRRNGISMIFQDPTAALNPVFSIDFQLRNIIKYAIESKEKLTKKVVKKYMLDILKKVMLPDPERILKGYSIQLSGGMRQRVCIAMALLTNPNLLICDEPGTSLDVTIGKQILELLENLVNKKDISVILISHALGTVKNITDRTYVMYAGSMVEVAKTAEIFTNPLHPYSQGLINAVPKLTGEGISQGIPGCIPEYLNPPTGCRFYPRCNYVKPICKVKKPPFFEIKGDHQVACWLFKKGGN